MAITFLDDLKLVVIENFSGTLVPKTNDFCLFSQKKYKSHLISIISFKKKIEER